MSVQVTEQMIDVFRSSCVSIPFADVEAEEGFVDVTLRGFDQAFEVAGQVGDQVLV
jgi:hypothetical protein